MQETKIQETYSYEEAYQNTLNYFEGDETATHTFINKYALRNDNGDLLESSPEQMHKRLANEFGRVEFDYLKKEDPGDNYKDLSEYGKRRYDTGKTSYVDKKSIIDFYFEKFAEFKHIIPQGRIMAGLGMNSYRSLSNCLVLPSPKDSYSSIMYTDTMLVNSAKRGCGYGIDMSHIRPDGTSTNNASRSSTGIVPFMERYSRSTREVGQDGRRGACLLSIDVRHPQVLDFAKAKQDRDSVTGANISVKLTDDFMDAVNNDREYVLSFPIHLDHYIDSGLAPGKLDDGKMHEGALGMYKKVNAKELYNEIVKTARDDSEPGLFLWDRMKGYEPAEVYDDHKVVTTNACGEQPMSSYDTCRLIVQNLFGYVINPYKENAEIDYDAVYTLSYEMLRMGDNLVDLEIEYIDHIINKIDNDNEPEEEKKIERDLWLNVRDKAQRGRRVGCGITGLGDMLAALGLKYDSEEAEKTIEKIMYTKMKGELDASIDLAILRGPFEDWDDSKEFVNGEGNNEFYDMLNKTFPKEFVSKMRKYGRRNINWSTIAPTGSVSILTQTTSGCEPLFQPYYVRRIKINPSDEHSRVDFIDQSGDKWQEYPVIHQKFKEWLENNYELNTDEIDQKELDVFFENSPYYNSTANDIDWVKRVEIQGILQKYTTSAISSTLNLPEDVTTEDVKKIYLKAWEAGLKGVTIYRDGSRTGVLVNKEENDESKIPYNNAPRRPKKLHADVMRFQNNYEKWIGFVGILNEHPYEIFTGKLDNFQVPHYVSQGKIVKSKTEDGSKYDFIYFDKDGEQYTIEWLNRAFDPEFWNYAKLISACLRHGMHLPSAINVVNSLKLQGDNINTWKNGIERVLKKYVNDGEHAPGKKCENCGSENLIFQEGCLSCSACGASNCS